MSGAGRCSPERIAQKLTGFYGKNGPKLTDLAAISIEARLLQGRVEPLRQRSRFEAKPRQLDPGPRCQAMSASGSLATRPRDDLAVAISGAKRGAF